MELKMQDSPVIQKTLELCQVLLDQPAFHEMRKHIDAFSSDEKARTQYQRVYEMQEALEQGDRSDDDQITAFEQERNALFANEVVRNFTDTQQALHKLQQTVSAYIAATFRLGRLPGEDDFERESCGPHCRCSGG